MDPQGDCLLVMPDRCKPQGGGSHLGQGDSPFILARERSGTTSGLDCCKVSLPLLPCGNLSFNNLAFYCSQTLSLALLCNLGGKSILLAYPPGITAVTEAQCSSVLLWPGHLKGCCTRQGQSKKQTQTSERSGKLMGMWSQCPLSNTDNLLG